MEIWNSSVSFLRDSNSSHMGQPPGKKAPSIGQPLIQVKKFLNGQPPGKEDL